MSEMRGGIGGYGGITTMNQDQRQGRYAPHSATLVLRDKMMQLVHVKCYLCDAIWVHPEGVVKNVPKKCK